MDITNRMKEYEKRNRYFLQKRMPVIVRLDMRAGHTFTKGFQRPFDEVFVKTMQETAKYLCENVMNCKLAYTQSDEISLLLIDYDKLNTESFFDYRVDKLCSIIASMATMEFNRKFIIFYLDYIANLNIDFNNTPEKDFYRTIASVYENASNKGAIFDARCFNIPKEEVTNNFYWRQLDASRNSIQMVGQANFSHKNLKNKSCNDIQNMLISKKNINWNELPIYLQHGSCIIKESYFIDNDGNEVTNDLITDIDSSVENFTMRTRWIIDKNIPIFKGDGRQYIEKLLVNGE